MSSEPPEEEPALTLRASPGGDPYEQSHMTPEGTPVLYRDKFVVGKTWHILMGAITLLSVLPMLLIPGEGGPVSAAVLGGVMFLLWALFAVLRVTVTTELVHIQLGLFGPRIAVDSLLSCEAVEYDWKKFGGWGIRYARDGEVAYNMLGDAGRAVRLRYVDKKGKERSVVVTSPEPGLLADAVHAAMRRAGNTHAPPLTDEAASAGEEEVIFSQETSLDFSNGSADPGEKSQENVHAQAQTQEERTTQ